MALPRHSRACSLLALLAAGVLLTGCDFGSEDTPVSATPSANEEPTPASTSSYLAAVARSSGETAQANLVLVDDVTGVQIASLPVDPFKRTLVAQAFTMAADGLSQQAGRQTRAYYTRQGQLFEVDLSHVAGILSLPTARRVSSETQACELRELISRDASATVNILRYTGPGADGDCSTNDDNDVRAVLSSADANTTPSAASFIRQRTDGSQVVQDMHLDVLRDTAGTLTHTLSLNAQNKLLITQASDLTTKEVTNGAISVDESISVFSKVAGRRDQVYLRVGNSVRVLDWAGLNASLSTAAVATLGSGQTPFVQTDAQATYYLDAHSFKPPGSEEDFIELGLWKLVPGAATAVPLGFVEQARPDELGQVAGSAMTDSAIALVMRHEQGDLLQFLDKATGGLRTTYTQGKAYTFSIHAHEGNTVIVSGQALDGSGSRLWREDATQTQAPQELSTSFTPLGAIHNATRTLAGAVQQDYFLWTDAGQVYSHALSGKTTAVVADNKVTKGWTGSGLSASLASSPVGLLIGPTTTAPETESVWLFDAGKAVVGGQ